MCVIMHISLHGLKKMNNTWKKIQLKDVADIVGGGTPSTKNPSYWNGEVAWLTPKDLSGYMERCISRGERNISREGLDNSSAILLPKGTVLLTSRAPIGYVAIANNPLSTNQGFKSLILKKGQNPLFYYYLLKANVEYIQNMGSGSTFKEVSGGVVKELTFLIPEYEEQKRIAEILGSLDDKIELLQKQNKTLEDMAKALFKSWFVDFDVVRAKQKGLPKADIMREYHLTDELYDLFPSSFADSPLGPIPSGWEVKPLSKIATFLNGLALQKYPARAEEDFLPVIKIAELRNGISTSTDKANTNLPTEYIVHNGDILFSWSGSLMVKVWSGEKGALNQHLFKVFSNGYPKWFYYLWVNHYLPMFQEIAADKATTMGHIQRKHLDQAKVVCPSSAFLDKMDKIFGVILSKIILNNKQIQTLTELRDTLLPRLISGKIRV